MCDNTTRWASSRGPYDEPYDEHPCERYSQKQKDLLERSLLEELGSEDDWYWAHDTNDDSQHTNDDSQNDTIGSGGRSPPPPSCVHAVAGPVGGHARDDQFRPFALRDGHDDDDELAPTDMDTEIESSSQEYSDMEIKSVPRSPRRAALANAPLRSGEVPPPQSRGEDQQPPPQSRGQEQQPYVHLATRISPSPAVVCFDWYHFKDNVPITEHWSQHDRALQYHREVARRSGEHSRRLPTFGSEHLPKPILKRGAFYHFDHGSAPDHHWSWHELVAQLDDDSMQLVVEGYGPGSRGLVACMVRESARTDRRNKQKEAPPESFTAAQLEKNVGQFKKGDPHATVATNTKDLDEIWDTICAEKGQCGPCGEKQEQSPVVTEIAESPAVAEIEGSQARAAVVTTSSRPSSAPPEHPMPRRLVLTAVPDLNLQERNALTLVFGENSPPRSPSAKNEDAPSTKSESTFNDSPRSEPLIFSSREERREPATHNQNSGTGNVGIYLCNLGTQSIVGSRNDKARAAEVRIMMDNCFRKNAGQITIVTEANREVEEMLRMPATAGTENPVLKENEGRKLEDRETWENHVVRIDEDCETVLIAARKTLFKELVLLHQ